MSQALGLPGLPGGEGGVDLPNVIVATVKPKQTNKKCLRLFFVVVFITFFVCDKKICILCKFRNNN